MEFGRIVSDSFKIAWRNKSLWVFGFFASTMGIGFSFDPSTRDFFIPGSEWRVAMESARMAIAEEFVLAWIIIIGVISLIMFALHLICLPALIDGVNKIKRGGHFRIGDSLSVGLDFFGRFIGLAMIALPIAFLAFGLSVMVGLALPNVSTAALSIMALLCLPGTLFIGFMIISILALAQRAIVVRNVGIADGLHEGFELLKQNFLRCMAMFLIYVGFLIGLAIGAVICMVIVAIPLVLLAVIAESIAVLIIILGLIIGFPLMLVMIAFANTFLQNLYTLFYFELVEPAGPIQPVTAAPAAPLA